MTALQNEGHDVYFLSLYHFDGMQENMGSVVFESFPEKNTGNKSFLYRLFHFPIDTFLSSFYKWTKMNRYSLKIENEKKPGFDYTLINKSIGGEKYDLVFTLYLEEYISSFSLMQIYKQLQCPIFVMAIDMYPMTGGCYYFQECKNYQNECLDCPAKRWKGKIMPHENYEVKKEIYSTIDCTFLCNTYMRNIFFQSGLFKKNQVEYFPCIINEDVFSPYDQEQVRKNLGLPLNKFIMFAGSANIKLKRKGFSQLKQSLTIIRQNCGDDNVLLVLAGSQSKEQKDLFDVNCEAVGFLSSEKLSMMYAASDVYLSPSLDDAGPSMVNQSLMCGTPVVAFNIGVALDVVKDKGTGYVAELGNVEDFANGVISLYNTKDRSRIRERCRALALSLFSRKAVAERIEEIYKNKKEEYKFC